MTGGAEGHVPVLAEAAVEWLNVRPEGIYVDATAGAGGHSSLIAARLRSGRLIALDRDPSAVARTRERLRPYPCAEVRHGNYGQLDEVLAVVRIDTVDGVLIDAGVSSMQLDDPARGFSFQDDGPLDMRMDSSSSVSATEYLSQITEDELAGALRRYGDVGPVRRIARAILRRRDEGALRRTRDLVDAVREGLGVARDIPEETRTVFQAIRIAVNGELHWLEQGIRQAITVLNPGGRLVVISFHSGEDRVVKETLRAASRPRRILRPDGRVAGTIDPVLRLLTPKPIVPDSREMASNPRSKSARLRAAERLGPSRTEAG
jgi:16S rRNA (cytosine1402-N4)-methyltransferase